MKYRFLVSVGAQGLKRITQDFSALTLLAFWTRYSFLLFEKIKRNPVLFKYQNV
jgi:hypothetical protein